MRGTPGRPCGDAVPLPAPALQNSDSAHGFHSTRVIGSKPPAHAVVGRGHRYASTARVTCRVRGLRDGPGRAEAHSTGATIETVNSQLERIGFERLYARTRPMPGLRLKRMRRS